MIKGHLVLTKSKSKHKDLTEFPELEENKDGLGFAGNENKEEFKDIVASQFVYLYEHSKDEK